MKNAQAALPRLRSVLESARSRSYLKPIAQFVRDNPEAQGDSARSDKFWSYADSRLIGIKPGSRAPGIIAWIFTKGKRISAISPLVAGSPDWMLIEMFPWDDDSVVEQVVASRSPLVMLNTYLSAPPSQRVDFPLVVQSHWFIESLLLALGPVDLYSAIVAAMPSAPSQSAIFSSYRFTLPTTSVSLVLIGALDGVDLSSLLDGHEFRSGSNGHNILSLVLSGNIDASEGLELLLMPESVISPDRFREIAEITSEGNPLAWALAYLGLG